MTPDAVGGRSVMRSLQLSGKFIAEDGTHEHNYNLGIGVKSCQILGGISLKLSI